MLNEILIKLLETLLTKLGAFIYEQIVEWFEKQKDEGDIRDAFESENEGDVASGLDDVFRR